MLVCTQNTNIAYNCFYIMRVSHIEEFVVFWSMSCMSGFIVRSKFSDADLHGAYLLKILIVYLVVSDSPAYQLY